MTKTQLKQIIKEEVSSDYDDVDAIALATSFAREAGKIKEIDRYEDNALMTPYEAMKERSLILKDLYDLAQEFCATYEKIKIS